MTPGELTMTNLIVPSSLTVAELKIQLAGFKFGFSCKRNPVEGEGHETRAVLEDVREIVSSGPDPTPGKLKPSNEMQPR